MEEFAIACHIQKLPTELSLSNWRYVDIVCGEMNKKGYKVVRKLWTININTSASTIAIIVQLLELIMALKNGVKYFSVSYSNRVLIPRSRNCKYLKRMVRNNQK